MKILKKIFLYFILPILGILLSLFVWFLVYTSELKPLKEQINKRAQGDIVNPGFNTARFYYFISGTITKKAYKNYIQSLDISENDTLMNFGCGPGAEALILSEKLEEGNGHLTCLDISETWIEVAKIRLKNKKSVDFICADVTKSELTPGKYSGIIIHFVLHDIPAEIRPEVLISLYKTLNQGGKIYLNEPFGEGHGISLTETEKLMQKAGFEKESSKKISKLFGMSSNSSVFIKK